VARQAQRIGTGAGFARGEVVQADAVQESQEGKEATRWKARANKGRRRARKGEGGGFGSKDKATHQEWRDGS
jgi:hypothetical protein